MSSVQAAGEQPATLWDQLHRVIRGLRILLYVFAGLLVVILLGEAARIYRLAADIDPWLGYATGLALLGAAVLVGLPAYQFFRVPRVVEPPPVPAPEALRIGHLRDEARYLDRYLANCLRNPELAAKQEAILKARGELAEFAGRLKGALESQSDQLNRELCAWTNRTLPAIICVVDEKADRLIYQEALSVGLATAVSPNGVLDAFFMLWRSLRLVSQLAVLYYGRPGPWGTLVICKDVSIATALAGYLQNVTDSLGGLLARSLGGVTGMVAGPVVEGVTNALVLVRIGYLARQRCRALRRWDTQARRSALLDSLAATQKVAVGLTAEILRQVGSGLGAVAGAAASGVVKIASAAASGLSSAAAAAAGLFHTKSEEGQSERT